MKQLRAQWAADEEAKRKDAEAKAKGEWESVAKAKEAEAEALKAQLAQRDRADLQRRVAKEAGLPEEMASRLQGDDEAALKADAEALAKLIPPAPGPTGGGTTNPPRPPGKLTREQVSKMSRAEINANWDAVQEALKG